MSAETVLLLASTAVIMSTALVMWFYRGPSGMILTVVGIICVGLAVKSFMNDRARPGS